MALFGLHPALTFLHSSYAAKELTVLHAVASPYRERSHFDGQNVLESGGVVPHGIASGWINRALSGVAGQHPASGVALGANVPLAMRGPAEVASWSPTKIAALDDDTLARITDLYARDPLLSRRLAEALESDAIANEAQAAANAEADADMAEGTAANVVERDAEAASQCQRALHGDRARRGGFPQARRRSARGDVRHLRLGHARQRGWRAGPARAAAARARCGAGGAQGSLGPAWRNTVVLVATEFGRTAAINGTRGTDHGTGAAAFLLGGAVAGGRVIADWPGLARAGCTRAVI